MGSGRGEGFSGPLPIAWADIHAYFATRRVQPLDWEWRALKDLDGAFMLSRTTAKNVVETAKTFRQVIPPKENDRG